MARLLKIGCFKDAKVYIFYYTDEEILVVVQQFGLYFVSVRRI